MLMTVDRAWSARVGGFSRRDLNCVS